MSSTSLTKSTKSANDQTAKRDWYVVDATDKVLGRLSTEIANRLRGKHKAEYTPHADTGDYIIVINADKIRVTGNKGPDKKYYRHGGQPGGLKETTFDKLIKEHPTRPLQKAIEGMMGKGPMTNARLEKLKIYAGAEHPHTAQQPKVLEI